VIRDLCPVHGEPMWHWPAGDAWACQRVTCEARRPVTQRDFMMRHFVETNRAMRETLLATPPRGLFRIVSTA
jgi:hypothetical protein